MISNPHTPFYSHFCGCLGGLARVLTLALVIGWFFHGPSATAQSFTPKEATYDVWGINSLDLSTPVYSPDKLGWTKLGSTNTSATFARRFNYYMVAVKSGQTLLLDAVQGADGSYYTKGPYPIGTLPTGNATGDTLNYIYGAPDYQYLVLKPPGGGGGSTYGAYAIFYNTSGWNSFRCIVYAQPPGGSRNIGLGGDLAFGSVPLGQTAQRTLTIANSGSGSLTITGINYPAGFSGAWAGVVPPGKSQKVVVTFTPAGATTYYGTMTVISDATYGNRGRFISGHTPVEAPYDVWASDYYDGNQFSQLYGPDNLGWVKLGSGTRVTQFNGKYKYYLVLAGKSDVVFLDAVRTSSGMWYSGPLATGSTLPGDGGATGAPDGKFEVLNGPGSGGIFSPYTYGAFALFYNIKGWSNLTFHTYVRPPTRVIGLSGNLDFGPVTIGSNAVGTLRIANSGDSPLNVAGVTGPHGFSGSWTGSIPAGGWQDVPVTFTPHTRTDRAGHLTVFSDATRGTNVFAVAGAGIWPPPLTHAYTRLAPALVLLPGLSYPFTPVAPLGAPAMCVWDFGDGGASADCATVHMYTNCGLHNVTYHGSGGMTSTDTNFTVAVPCPLNLTNPGSRATARALFSNPTGDSFSFTAYADLGPAFSPSNKTVIVSFAGAELSFLLNNAGKAITYPHSCRLKYSRATGLWSVIVTGKAGQWRDTWGDYGLINATVPLPGTDVTVPIVVQVGDMAFQAEKRLRYTARPGKLGTAK